VFLSLNIRPLFVFVFPVILMGCRGETGPSGPVLEPVLTGTVRGSVQLYLDYFPDDPLPNSGGVTVEFQPGGFRAISLTDGTWDRGQLPAGIYSVKFTKPGYFVRQIYNVQFVASGGTFYLDPVRLCVIPTVNVQLDSLVLDPPNVIRCYGRISAPASEYRGVALLLSRTPINTTAIPFEFDRYISTAAPPGSINFSGAFYIDNVSRPTFHGSTIYAVALPISHFYFSDIHPLTGRRVFDTPGVSFSGQKSVFVP
jgi:hypothetical protein